MEENINQLVEIYNALLTVKTNGTDSFTMTDCMRALYQIINDMAKQLEETVEEE